MKAVPYHSITCRFRRLAFQLAASPCSGDTMASAGLIILACRSTPSNRSTSVKQNTRKYAPAKACHARKARREAHRWRLQHEDRARSTARPAQSVSPEQATCNGKQRSSPQYSQCSQPCLQPVYAELVSSEQTKQASILAPSTRLHMRVKRTTGFLMLSLRPARPVSDKSSAAGWSEEQLLGPHSVQECRGHLTAVALHIPRTGVALGICRV